MVPRVWGLLLDAQKLRKLVSTVPLDPSQVVKHDERREAAQVVVGLR